MKKIKLKMNKPTYLDFPILEISKTLMYEFWYDYMKPKYKEKVKLCYTDTDSFISHIKIEDFYKYISDDVDKRFDTSNYECCRPLAIGINKKEIGLMKDELGGKIMKGFVGLRAKTYSCLMDDGTEIKKQRNKKCVIETDLWHQDFKDCVLNDIIILKSQQRFKSEAHHVCTEVNKIALSSNDDKKLLTYDGVTTYPYGYKN